MQTLPLLQRLVRRWKVDSLANMPADVKLSLLDCINASIQEFYSNCPAVYREGWVTGILGAPVATTFGVTQGSNAFTGYTASANQFGCTAVIGPDLNDNMLVPPNGLLDAYEGTTGTQNATVYGDAFPLPANIETMLDEPQLLGYLPRLRREDLYWGRPWNPSLFWSESLIATPYRQVARPRSYWVEPNLPDLNGVPTFIFRVDPMPNVLYRVRFRALFYPQRLTMGNMQQNATLTVNEAWIESLFIPLILEHMASKEPDLWQGADIKLVIADAEKAREGIAKLRVDISKPNNRIETPAGY